MIFNQQPPAQGGGGSETVTVSIEPEYGMIVYAISDGPGSYMAERAQQIDAYVGSYLTVYTFGYSLLMSEEDDNFDNCFIGSMPDDCVFTIPVLDHDMTLIAS